MNMKDWITVLTLTYPHEAHLVKGKLESEGIEVQLIDEMTVQVHNFYSNAIGGIKLSVRKADFQRARQILIDHGYIEPEEQTENRFLNWFDRCTAGFPWIGKTALGIRLLIFVTIIFSIAAILIVSLATPSKLERLTENIWCVDTIHYKGQVLGSNWTGSNFNCSETMEFRENGVAIFSETDSNEDGYSWELKNDSLVISERNVNNDHSPGNSHEITGGQEFGKTKIPWGLCFGY